MLSSEFLAELLSEILQHPIIKEIAKYPREVMLPIILAPSGILIPKQAELGSEVRVCTPDIEKVVEICQAHKAKYFMLLHNHPERDKGYVACPSENDIHSTAMYQIAALLHGLVLVDHIILSPNSYFSFRGAGLL